jgi:hypothetical protein
MDRNEVPQSNLSIASHIGLYLDIITDRFIGHLTSLTLALHIGLYFVIIMNRYGGTHIPLL